VIRSKAGDSVVGTNNSLYTLIMIPVKAQEGERERSVAKARCLIKGESYRAGGLLMNINKIHSITI